MIGVEQAMEIYEKVDPGPSLNGEVRIKREIQGNEDGQVHSGNAMTNNVQENGNGNYDNTKPADNACIVTDTQQSETNKDHDLENLSNPSYVDSLTSNDSRTALLSSMERRNLVDLSYSNPNIRQKFSDVKMFSALDIRERSGTMSGLRESSAYLEPLMFSSHSQRQLTSACRNAMLTLSQEAIPQGIGSISSKLAVNSNKVDIEDNANDDEEEYISSHMKNLIFLGISISLMNTAISSLRNLQSSLNHIDGIGLYSNAASYAGFMVFSLVTPFIVQRFRPKRCLVLSLIPQLIYVFTNLYPSFHVFIPAAFIQGMANALIWNAISTYITYLARSYALLNDQQTVPIASKYFGVLFFFYQFSVVFGNLISSFVLMNGDFGAEMVTKSTANISTLTYLFSNGSVEVIGSRISHCGVKYCDNVGAASGPPVDIETKYVLFGVYGVCVAFSLVIAIYLLDPLKPYRITSASCSVVCKQLVSVLRLGVDGRFLRLFLLFAYTAMQMSFVAGDVTKAFVTCGLGIQMVGYTMVCYGICGGFSSYISGCLNKYLGHIVLLTSAAVLNLLLVLLMSLWQPESDQVVLFFAMVGAWGLGDGIWLSQASSLVSQVFPDKLEEAFAAQRFVQGLGGAVTFCYASSLCMSVKLNILAAVCISGLIFYIIQELVGRRSTKEEQEDLDTKPDNGV